MELRLSPEGERIVRRLVDDGRYGTPAEAVEAALQAMEARDANNPLRRAVAFGLEQALAGRSTSVTLEELVSRVNRREAVR